MISPSKKGVIMPISRFRRTSLKTRASSSSRSSSTHTSTTRSPRKIPSSTNRSLIITSRQWRQLTTSSALRISNCLTSANFWTMMMTMTNWTLLSAMMMTSLWQRRNLSRRVNWRAVVWPRRVISLVGRMSRKELQACIQLASSLREVRA